MWKVLCILLLASDNFCTVSNSAKLTGNDRLPTDGDNERQDYLPTEQPSRHDGYLPKKDKEEHELIGRWRSNGEAIEPKWRDGDSVPLVPFHAASFQNVWQNGYRSGKEAEAVPEIFEQDDSLGSYSTNIKYFATTQDTEANSEIYKSSRTNYRNEPDSYELNLEQLISSTEQYPIDRDYEHTHRNGYKSYKTYESRRSGNKSPRLTPDGTNDDNNKFRDSGANPNLEKHLEPGNNRNGHFYANDRDKNRYSVPNGGQEESYKEDSDEDRHSLIKYRETFQNRPNEYELNEDEYERPRPRKRRPPQNYEFLQPTSLYAASLHEEKQSLQQNSDKKKTETSRSHRKPYSTRNLENGPGSGNENPKEVTENTDLKSLLKMHADGLSLSEILQQKNLTLSDLLKRKPNAISVLKATNQESASVEETAKIQGASENSVKVSTTQRPHWMPNPKLRTKNADSKISESSLKGIVQNPELSRNSPSMMKPEDDHMGDRKGKQPLVEEIQKTSDSIRAPEVTNDDFTSASTEYVNNRKIVSFDTTKRRLIPIRNRTLIKDFKKRLLEPIRSENANKEKAIAVGEAPVDSEPNEGTMSESDDEDEIMEFSDFTVKKPYTTTTRYEPMTEESSEILGTDFVTQKKSNSFADPDLLLSIEHILTSTERMLTTSRSNSVGDLTGNELKIKGDLELLQRNQKSFPEQNETVEKPQDEKLQLPDMPSKKENSTEEWNLLGISDSKHENEGVHRIIENNDKNGEIYSTFSEDPSVSSKGLVPNTTKNHALYEEIVSEMEPEARAEISELFSSGSSAKRLERLLSSRNMSIEELIALRQRGSSRVHLAEVFASKDQILRSQKDREKSNDDPSLKQPNQQQSQTYQTGDQNIGNHSQSHVLLVGAERIGMAKTEYELEKEVDKLNSNLSTLFNYHNTTKMKPTLEKTGTKLDRDTPKSHNSSKHNRQELNAKSVTETSSSKSKKILDVTTTFDSLPFSKNIQQDSEGSSYWTSITEVKLPIGNKEQRKYLDPLQKAGNLTSFAEFGRVEEILNNDLKPLTDVYGSNDYGKKEKKTMSKVKPSIIASGAILGVTVVVFLAIFIACRIRQKQKFTYKNSFSRAVFSGPVMTARKLSNTSSLNTIMVNVVATSTTKRPQKNEDYDDETYESRSDIDHDSLDANDSWDTIPDFMK